MCSLIRGSYSPHRKERYNPSNNSILNCYEGHNNETYISLKYNITANNIKKLIGTMSCIPYDFNIFGRELLIYYVDFLCVHKKYRQQGLAPKIIYSHIVNFTNKHPGFYYIFKREGVLSSYVPLTVYNTYLYDTKHWVKNARFYDKKYNILNIGSSDISILNDVFVMMMNDNIFDCVYKPNINNLKILVKDHNLYIYVLMLNKTPLACYVYKNNHTTYDGETSITLLSSYSNTSDEIFVMGYLNTLDILNESVSFRYMLIENISHNYIILDNIMARYTYKYKCDTGYYFYNFAVRPFYSTKVFCIT